VDVRSPREFRSESLAGAANAPLFLVPATVPLGAVSVVLARADGGRDLLPFNEQFETQLRAALGPQGKERPAVVFCSDGTRSKQAAELLAEEDYAVRWLAGGLDGWLQAFSSRGLPRRRVQGGVFRDTSGRAIWTDSAEEDTILQASGGNTKDVA